MNTANLTTYLEDHLAGSVGALELLDDLIENAADASAATEFQALRAEIEADQKLLKDLLERLGSQESTLKKAGAWMAQKVMSGKLQPSDDLGMVEALEMLCLGIEGKLRLWRAVTVVDLGLDLGSLENRASEQIRKVEAMRIAAARRAFA